MTQTTEPVRDLRANRRVVLRAPSDVLSSNDEWGANCGPSSIAAALSLEVAQVREAVSPQPHGFKGYMGIRDVQDALRRLGCSYRDTYRVPFSSLLESEQPSIVMVNWVGPWSHIPKAQAAHRHLVAVCDGWIYEVWMGQWLPYEKWETLSPYWTPKRATAWEWAWSATVESVPHDLKAPEEFHDA